MKIVEEFNKLTAKIRDSLADVKRNISKKVYYISINQLHVILLSHSLVIPHSLVRYTPL